jgi:hypothetical protein
MLHGFLRSMTTRMQQLFASSARDWVHREILATIEVVITLWEIVGAPVEANALIAIMTGLLNDAVIADELILQADRLSHLEEVWS